MLLATAENTLLALEPTGRIVPTTITNYRQHHRVFRDILALVIRP